MSSHKKILFFSVALFFVFLWIGFGLARTKFLWTDEIYTQLSSIDRKSYGEIWSGKLQEGNNNPLFYASQKFTVDLFKYKGLPKWTGHPKIFDSKSQIILRINAVIFMSILLSFVFYYFSTRHNLWAGGLALLVFLTSGPIWAYWAEARPYCLWMALATVQFLSFRELFIDNSPDKKWKATLVVSNILMALTILFGIFQVFITSLLLAIRKKSIKEFFVLSGPPAFLVFLYYWGAPRYLFFFNKSPIELIFSLISPVYFILFGIYFLVVHFGAKPRPKEAGWGWPLFLMSAIAAALVGLLLVINKPSEASFAISSRYFLFLIPVYLIVTIEFLYGLFRYVNLNKEWMSPYIVGVFLFFVYLLVSQEDLTTRLLALYLS